MNTQRKQNLMAVAVAWVLAIGIFVSVWSSIPDTLTSLQANIVWVKQDPAAGEFIQQTYTESVRIQGNIAITDIASMSMYVMYDPDEVDLDLNNVSSDAIVVSSEENDWRVVLFLTQVSDIAIGDTLLSLPVTWDTSRVIISDIYIIFDDGEKSWVSITVE